MSAVFLKVLNMSITAGWLIAAVIAARLLLKKAPKWIVCLLWAMVGLRLLLPVSLKSVLSLIPSSETIPSNIALAPVPEIHSGIPFVNQSVNPVLSQQLAPSPVNSINPLQVWIPVAAAVWIAGIAVMLGYAFFSWRKLRRAVSAAVPVSEGVRACDEIGGSFILGVFRPVIYVPSGLGDATLEQILRHEQAHLRRRDHWWKPLGYLLLSVYWFHPLAWAAYLLLCRDIELACDEKVIRDMDRENLADYSQALLECGLERRRISACPLAFGEVGVKQRIRNVLHYRRPAFWVIAAALVLSAVILVCLMTDPFSDRGALRKPSVSMDMAIADHFHSEYHTPAFAATDYRILGTRHSADRTTVYALVLWEGFEKRDGKIQVVSGSFSPAAVTFDTSGDRDNLLSSHDVIEYWEPRDGTYYAEDIKAKFPLLLRGRALRAICTEEQKMNCMRAAEEYFARQDTVPAVGVPLEKEDAAGQKPVPESLREKYPEYFDLPTEDGLEVLVWKLSPTGASCALLPGMGVERGIAETFNLKGTGLDEMREILSAYGLPRERISVVAFQQPYSSYLWATQKEDIQRIRELLLGESVCAKSAYAGYTSNDSFQLTQDSVMGWQGRLPLYRVESRVELENLMQTFSEVLATDNGLDEMPSLREAAERYDDDFFASHTLLIAYVSVSSGSFRFGLDRVEAGETFRLFVKQLNHPEVYNASMSGWYILTEVPNAVLDGCMNMEAVLE